MKSAKPKRELTTDDRRLKDRLLYEKLVKDTREILDPKR